MIKSEFGFEIIPVIRYSYIKLFDTSTSMNWRSPITTLLAALVIYPHCCCLMGAHSETSMSGCGDAMGMAMPACCPPGDSPTPQKEDEKSCPHQEGKPLLKQSANSRDILKTVSQNPLVSPYLPLVYNDLRPGLSSFAALERLRFLRSPPMPLHRKMHFSYLL